MELYGEMGTDIVTRGGGVLKKVLYREALPRGPTPYSFIYHFFRKGTPFAYLLLEKGTPFTYLLKKTYE